MTQATSKELTVKINLNTIITMVSAALIVAATAAVFSMKTDITALKVEVANLKVESVRHGDAIDEVQKGVNRLQVKGR